jgi:hypothetical protein
MKNKACTRCGDAKEPAEFPRNKRTRDGLSSWCRSCHNEARRVVARYVYDAELKRTVPNPDPRPKSKVR